MARTYDNLPQKKRSPVLVRGGRLAGGQTATIVRYANEWIVTRSWSDGGRRNEWQEAYESPEAALAALEAQIDT